MIHIIRLNGDLHKRLVEQAQKGHRPLADHLRLTIELGADAIDAWEAKQLREPPRPIPGPSSN